MFQHMFDLVHLASVDFCHALENQYKLFTTPVYVPLCCSSRLVTLLCRLLCYGSALSAPNAHSARVACAEPGPDRSWASNALHQKWLSSAGSTPTLGTTKDCLPPL